MTDEEFHARVKDWMSGACKGEPVYRYVGVSWAEYCRRMGFEAEDATERLEAAEKELAKASQMNALLREENDRLLETNLKLNASVNRERVRLNNLQRGLDAEKARLAEAEGVTMTAVLERLIASA
jgi:hypothetical protein